MRLFLVSICLGLCSSCTQVVGQEPQTATSVAPAAASDAVASEALQELGRVVEQYIDDDRAVGAELLVIQDGQTLFHESFGFSDREDKRRWENQTLCNIRSMTKPITSAAAQILIDRKLLELDKPVAHYLKSFDNEKSKSITVRQVITHRSGLPLSNLFAPYQYDSLAEQVAAAGKSGPQFEPDSKFWYSDTGTDVVGRLVEKVTGEPLPQFVQREIFDPLGMTNTIYGIDPDDERLTQAASLYLKVPAGWFRFWIPKKPLYPFAWGSQTVYSTTTDYAKFLQMMMDGGRVGARQLLSTAAVDRMLQPISRMKQLGSDADAPTGFRGLKVYYGQMMVTHRASENANERPVVLGHSGSDGTNAWAWPERDLMILYFTQSRGGLTPVRLERPIDRLIIHPGEALVEEEVRERLGPYVGSYMANYDKFDNEEFTVTIQDGKLVLDVPSQLVFELLEPDEKGFWAFAQVPDEVQATFDRNEQAEVVGLRLHKAGQVYEVPRKGTARAKQLARQVDGLELTTWKGTLHARDHELRLEIDITDKAGQLTGQVRSLDQNNARLKMEDITLDAESFRFAVPRVGAKFDGKFAGGGAIAEGTFSQNGVTRPLTLRKADAE
jgi:CubicO group peptidase (beta-lactamase class C family)